MARALPGVTQLLRLRQTDSTQTVAKFLAAQGAAEGTLVWADRQSAGRGRLERRWSSPEGGLYFSLILRPRLPPKRLAELSLLAAKAVALALSATAGVEARVKPPNDVLAFRGRKGGKICGILIEASGGFHRLDWTVVGVGINVNNKPPLSRTTSLSSLTGKSWELEALLAAVLAALGDSYRAFIALK